MTRPRQVYLGTVMITRRCVQRRLLLRPEKELHDAFRYVILYAAKKFAVDVHGLVVMSNHYHMVLSPTELNLPRFLHWVNLHMAKLVNVARKRRDAVWSSVDKTSVVQLADAAAALKELVYVAVNPVEAGLVATPAEWPGLRTLPSDVGRTLVAERPDYFRSGAEDEKDVLPARVELELTRPPAFGDLTDGEFRSLLGQQVDEAAARIRADRRAAGRGFLGESGVRAQDPESHPGGPGCPDFKLSPTVAAGDKWRRIELLQQRAEFLADYRRAWSAFRAGDRNVRFPEGTYGPCVVYGARCHGDPPKHAGAASRVRLAA
jgi:REP element-mobilizing transposase RayT